MLGVSIFTGIYYWIMKTDVGYAFTHALRQPLVAALWIGLIMGDVKQAIIIGAAVQILYIGLVAAGSNLPADDCLAGLIAIPIALSAGMTSAQSITLAVPVGVLGVFLDQIRKTVNVVFVHMGDKYAEDGNAKGIVICNVVLPTILSFFMRFPVSKYVRSRCSAEFHELSTNMVNRRIQCSWWFTSSIRICVNIICNRKETINAIILCWIFPCNC